MSDHDAPGRPDWQGIAKELTELRDRARREREESGKVSLQTIANLDAALARANAAILIDDIRKKGSTR